MKSIPVIDQLIQKGVRIPNPHSVEIGEEICIDRIAAQGVVLYAGSKLYGKETLICEGARIGYEGPATLVDCHVGPQVALKSGFFQEAVFHHLHSMTTFSMIICRNSNILMKRSPEKYIDQLHSVTYPEDRLLMSHDLIQQCELELASQPRNRFHRRSHVLMVIMRIDIVPPRDKKTVDHKRIRDRAAGWRQQYRGTPCSDYCLAVPMLHSQADFILIRRYSDNGGILPVHAVPFGLSPLKKFIRSYYLSFSGLTGNHGYYFWIVRSGRTMMIQ